MNELIYSQGDMFVVSLIMGFCMGFTYDILRGIRKAFSHSDFIVGVEDVLYWLIWTWIFILNILKFNEGSFRIYIFIVSITGLIIYENTIGRGFLKVTVYILCFVKKCLKKVKKMLKNGVIWVKIKLSLFRFFNKKEKEKDVINSSGITGDER